MNLFGQHQNRNFTRRRDLTTRLHGVLSAGQRKKPNSVTTAVAVVNGVNDKCMK